MDRQHANAAEVASGLITLERATVEDAGLLSNLLELYIHDLSAVFRHVALGEDGRYGYPGLSRYWSEPDRRFAFLIRCDGHIAGFALATRGSPLSDDPQVLDVAEFFVLRRYRASGVGRRAANLLWRSMPGRWMVRVGAGNAPALQFWTRVLAEHGQGGATEEERSGPPERPSGWYVFTFES
jgi:predicted acetyltransferase